MNKYILVAIITLCIGCKQEPSLQKYFVESGEKKEFMALDVSSSILNINKSKLSASEKAALASFDKVNILAFKKDGKNNAQYTKEIKEVKEILKDETYQELMKVGSGKDGATVYFVGEDEHIEEFVLLANKKENGFAIVRVLGNDMNPTHILNMLSLLQKSQVDMEQLKPLQQLMK